MIISRSEHLLNITIMLPAKIIVEPYGYPFLVNEGDEVQILFNTMDSKIHLSIAHGEIILECLEP